LGNAKSNLSISDYEELLQDVESSINSELNELLSSVVEDTEIDEDLDLDLDLGDSDEDDNDDDDDFSGIEDDKTSGYSGKHKDI
jgi:hypothetical protein